jgi:hypothetical protein
LVMAFCYVHSLIMLGQNDRHRPVASQWCNPITRGCFSACTLVTKMVGKYRYIGGSARMAPPDSPPFTGRLMGS